MNKIANLLAIGLALVFVRDAGAGDKELEKPRRIEGVLKADDPADPVTRNPRHVHKVSLRGGQPYVITLNALENSLDPFLRIEDRLGKELGRDDDGGGGLNSRLFFLSPKDGGYKVIATAYKGTGRYLLQVEESPETVHVVGKDGLKIEGKINRDDPPLAQLKGAPHKVVHVLLEAGQSYHFDLESREFDAFLIVRNAAGKVLAYDDDGGEGLNSRLQWKASESGIHLIVIAALNRASGSFLFQTRIGTHSKEDLERKVGAAKWRELSSHSLKAWRAGDFSLAQKTCEDALLLARHLYSRETFPNGHTYLATSLDNMAALLKVQGKLTEAEPLCREALAMRKRLFKGDHPDVASSLNSLAVQLDAQGRLAEAEPLYRDALAMNKRLFKGDHPDVASSLNNLGFVLESQKKLVEAEPLLREALAMTQRLTKGDHADLAGCINNLAVLLAAQGRLAEAETLQRDALTMLRRVFNEDHPDEAGVLTTMAYILQAQGKFAEAGPVYRDALAIRKRLFKGDHPVVARSLINLGSFLRAEGKLAEAEPLCRDAVAMSRRHIETFARIRSEGASLTLAAARPLYRDGFLSCALEGKNGAAETYPEIWSDKGSIGRIYERRQQAARAGACHAEVASLLGDLADARRRRADLLLAPAVKDPGTIKQREKNLGDLEVMIANLNKTLRPHLPALARSDKLALAKPADLQKFLPANTALVDFLRYFRFEFDREKPGKAGEKVTACYLAFVVTRDKIAWVGLENAEDIETAVVAWRKAITSGKEISAAIPAKVRELVWTPLRKELPAGIKTVYICPDDVLCRLPWAALPGDKPGTILLEDFTLATVPHAPFLLDQLWPRDPLKHPPTATLVVGGVKYDAEPSSAKGEKLALRSGPLLKPGANLGWSFLPGTVVEANGVMAAAKRKKFSPISLEGDSATAPALLAALPKAKHAHLATHGFFADPFFRSAFQLHEKDYERSRRGERIGRAANSPLVMTGLVFAGANHPKTPGRGILTGEALIDLDLTGLELAVLSACETGLGDVAGGEGTFGLQRAFHLAGTRNVVASLWKVPDRPTAALMNLFYRNLWEKELPPMEALRQAQLEIYRNPKGIADLAKDFRGKFEEAPGAGGAVEPPPAAGGRAHPLLWAAFTLSGPGR